MCSLTVMETEVPSEFHRVHRKEPSGPIPCPVGGSLGEFPSGVWGVGITTVSASHSRPLSGVCELSLPSLCKDTCNCIRTHQDNLPIPPSSVYHICKDPFPEVMVVGSRTPDPMSLCMDVIQPTAVFMSKKGRLPQPCLIPLGLSRVDTLTPRWCSWRHFLNNRQDGVYDCTCLGTAG